MKCTEWLVQWREGKPRKTSQRVARARPGRTLQAIVEIFAFVVNEVRGCWQVLIRGVLRPDLNFKQIALTAVLIIGYRKVKMDTGWPHRCQMLDPGEGWWCSHKKGHDRHLDLGMYFERAHRISWWIGCGMWEKDVKSCFNVLALDYKEYLFIYSFIVFQLFHMNRFLSPIWQPAY